MLKLKCPECGCKTIRDGQFCRRCGYKGRKQEFIIKGDKDGREKK